MFRSASLRLPSCRLPVRPLPTFLLRYFRHKRHLKTACAALAIAVIAALAWLTVHAPRAGRNPTALAMEQDAARFFATERDLAAFAQDLRAGSIRSVGLSSAYALVEHADGARYYLRIDAQPALVADLLKQGLTGAGPAVIGLQDIEPPAAPLIGFARRLGPAAVTLIGPLLILYLLVTMNPGRGSARMFRAAERPESRFDDVIGVAEAKESLQDLVAYLRDPRKFSRLGGRPPKGVLLGGDPGTGKTLLARAVAGEAGVPFIALAGGDFSDMFLGVGVRRVKKLFQVARDQAPCVVFIDEIDGLGRRSRGASASETENNRIINALLVELDGFAAHSGVVVLGATNNPDNVDPALVRPGRFDRRCHLGLPDVEERGALFGLYARDLLTAERLDLRQLARLSTGLSPAAIADIANGAALMAAKQDAAAVTQEHFRRVIEQTLMGGAAEGRSTLREAERQRIAVHEAGHALLARLLRVGIVEKVSILKRGRALGVTLVTSEQDLTLQSEAELRARMSMLLGGRGAEKLMLGSLSTGAANDLERVSKIAYRMVAEFGFSETIGPFSYGGLDEGERGRPGSHTEAIAEARRIVKQVEQTCHELLVAHRAGLERLAAALLEHETVDAAVVERCLALPQLAAA